MKDSLVLTHWTLRSGLIQAYTVPYLRLMSEHLEPGHRITLVTLEQPAMALSAGEADAAREELARYRIEWIPFSYHRFGLEAIASMGTNLLRLLWLSRRRQFTSIHCFCTPAGALGVLLSYLTEIPLIIDSYEPHAEAQVENGTWTRSCAAFRLLFFLEGLQSRRAAAIIATSPGMRDYARTRYGASFERFFVKPACVDLRHFRKEGIQTEPLAKELGTYGKIVCLYAGKLGGIYLEREVFDLFAAAAKRWGDRFRALLLTSDSKESIDSLCRETGFDRGRLIQRFVEHRDIPRYMALADFALTPVKPLPAKRYCAPIKDGEYWAMGLPVIITQGISDDSDIIERRRIGAVLRGFSQADYDKALCEIESILSRHSRAELYRMIRGVAVETRSLAIAEEIYRSLYGMKEPVPA